MEREEDFKTIFGELNWKKIINSVENGDIAAYEMQLISIAMGANGVFKQTQSEGKRPVEIFRRVVDSWYRTYLCQHKEKGLEQFKDILNKDSIGLQYLAEELVQENCALQESDNEISKLSR